MIAKLFGVLGCKVSARSCLPQTRCIYVPACEGAVTVLLLFPCILIPRIKQIACLSTLSALSPIPGRKIKGWETQGGKIVGEREKTAQQDSYHLSPQCDSLISAGFSSPLNSTLHRHPSIIPCLLRFLSASLSSVRFQPVEIRVKHKPAWSREKVRERERMGQGGRA